MSPCLGLALVHLNSGRDTLVLIKFNSALPHLGGTKISLQLRHVLTRALEIF